jgi:RNA polymerase sigma-70 factor (ECF subfamily)
METPPESLDQDFEALMRHTGPMIYTLAARLAGNTADGQDLAQETFVKAYEHWERFRGESDPGTWLYRICVNLWKNRVRYEKRRFFWRHFSIDGSGSEEEPLREIPAAEPPAGTQVEHHDLHIQVQEALATLSPQDRALLVMCDMDDKSYEEIAELLEVPLGTVKSRIARSRERLRQILAPSLKDLR